MSQKKLEQTNAPDAQASADDDKHANAAKRDLKLVVRRLRTGIRAGKGGKVADNRSCME